MMINLQALIPDSYPCIVEANTIEAIYLHEIQVGKDFTEMLVLKQYNTSNLINLKRIGYSDSPTSEIMSKVTFTIQAAKDGKLTEGTS